MRAVVAVLAAGVMALAGCGAEPADEPGPDGPAHGAEVAPVSPPVRQPAATTPGPAGRLPHCPSRVSPAGPVRGAERLSAGFVPVQVYVCTDVVRTYRGEGDWVVRQELRATGGVAALLAALRRADQRPAPGAEVACTLELPFVPELRLVAASGRVLHPAVPTDVCGKPQAEAMRAYRALSTETVAEVRLRQVQSEQSKTTGCADEWKDMIAIEAPRTVPGGPGQVFDRPAPNGTVCLYRVAPGGGATPVGTLERGRAVPGPELRSLAGRLNAAGPARSCAARHTRFAVVLAGGQDVYIELDGCRRVQAGSPPGLRQADRGLVALAERLARRR